MSTIQFDVTDATGNTIAVPAYTQRRQSLLRITGDRVWVNFNEPAVAGECEYIDAGDSLRFWGDRATANVFLVCDAGLSATAYIVEGATNMEIEPGLPRESNGGLPVNVQDQTTPPIDFFFTQITGPPTTVAVAIGPIGPTTFIYDVVVADSTGCDAGDYFGMFNADDPLNNRATFGTILAVDAGTDTITLDTPIDFNFQPGDTAACFSRDMDVDGSTTPQIFSVQVGPNATQSIDITRFMVSMYTASAVDLGKFGDLDSLTNGCVLRRVDGDTRNIWNVKNNGELANITFDYEPYTEVGQGQDGAKWRNTYAGADKHGVAIRLDPGDALQLVIQDDLTGIEQFRIIAEGHYVGD
jgi:hypothetical protein